MKKLGIVAIVVLCLCMIACSSNASERKMRGDLTSYTNEEKQDCILLSDGSSVELPANVYSWGITPDRKTLVYRDKYSNNGYIKKVNQEESTQFAERCGEILYIRDDGFFYTDYNANLHKYLFKNGEDVDLGRVYYPMFSPSGLGIAYVSDSNIYYIGENSTTIEKRASARGSASVIYASDNGLVCWLDSDCLYVSKDAKEEPMKVKFDFSPNGIRTNGFLQAGIFKDRDYAIYTKDGIFMDKDYASFEGIYIMGGRDLYYVDRKGETELVASDINHYAINAGTIYYMTKDYDLYCAGINKAKISGEKKIAVDIYDFRVVNNYLYYCKKDSGDTKTLYVSHKGEKAQMIADNVGSWTLSNLDDYYISYDGKSILYYCNCSWKSGWDIGDLCMYTYGNSSPKVISNDVGTQFIVRDDVFGGSDSKNYFDANSFAYTRYIFEGERPTFELYYYNGNKSVLVK